MRAATVVLLVLAAATPATAEPLYGHLRLLAPAAPGGGWDQTARAMQQALQAAGITGTSSVENIPGAAGTIGLARLVSAERGNEDVAMLSGLIMLAAVVTHQSPVTLGDVTPIARLLGEYEVVVVPAASPFQSLHDLIEAFRANPESVSWGGGSAGGTDQILAGMIANAVGVPPRRVNYIAFSGGGESLSAILGGQVSVGVNGLAEFAPHIEAGTVRVLGISSAARLPGLDVPTLREQGVDVELENWRSIVAPPGISPAARRRLEEAMTAMVASAPWQEVLARYRWNDRFLIGEAFASFSAEEEARVGVILDQFGLGSATAAGPWSVGIYPALVLAALAVTTLAVSADLWRTRAPASAPQGRWRPLLLIAAGMALDVLFIESLGFVPVSAVLFWLTARAFDRTHPVRDAVFAVVIAVAAFVLFGRILQLSLPSGVLAGWM